ncbi:MAG: RNA polymerase sigma factor [Pseudonocardiaceae bacterium]
MTELFRRAAAGDQAAWNAIVDRYTKLVWSVARAHRLGTADAADVVQTTWLRLVEHFGRIEDPERLAGWLATTARRECLRTLRRAGRELVGDIDDAILEAVEERSAPVDARLLAEERDVALWGCFERLSARCQVLLRILMATPPPDYATVSAALGMPVGSIGPTRGRCLDQLRKLATGAGLGVGTEARGVR